MTALRSPGIQRVVALLLVLCFALVTVEAPIADVHDGGATHAEVDRVTGDSHAHHGVAFGEGLSDRSSPRHSDHPVHVCHCTHAHASVLATVHVELRVWERIVPITVSSEVTPLAIALDPPTHPPTV